MDCSASKNDFFGIFLPPSQSHQFNNYGVNSNRLNYSGPREMCQNRENSIENQSFMDQRHNNNNWFAYTGPTTYNNNTNFGALSKRPSESQSVQFNNEMNSHRSNYSETRSSSGPFEMGYHHNFKENESFTDQRHNNNNWFAYTGPTTYNNNTNFEALSKRPSESQSIPFNNEMNSHRSKYSETRSSSGPFEMGYHHNFKENESFTNQRPNSSNWFGSTPFNHNGNVGTLTKPQAEPQSNPFVIYEMDSDSNRLRHTNTRSSGSFNIDTQRHNFNANQSFMDQHYYSNDWLVPERPTLLSSDPLPIDEKSFGHSLNYSETPRSSSSGPSEMCSYRHNLSESQLFMNRHYNETNWSALIRNTDVEMAAYSIEVENRLKKATGGSTLVDSHYNKGTDQNISSTNGTTWDANTFTNTNKIHNFYEKIENRPNVQDSISSGLIENTVYGVKIPESDYQLDSGALKTIPETLTQRRKNVIISSRSRAINILSSQSGSCNNSDMYVPTSDIKGKKLCCPYCFKKMSKLARHLETIHKNETDVKAFHDLPKGSKQRRRIIDTLRKRGTNEWNKNKKLNNNELMVSRRPNRNLNKNANDYITCWTCLGMYTVTAVRKHVAKCLDNPIKGEHITMLIGRSLDGRIHTKACDRLKNIFPIYIEDDVLRIIKYDWLLITYGNLLCSKHSKETRENYIRRLLRYPGRLLLAIKEINPAVTDFASIYDPALYDDMIEAIRVVAGHDPIKNTWKTPANARLAVTQIKQIGHVLFAEYIKKKEAENMKQTELYLFLMENNANQIICKTAVEAQVTMKRKKKTKIPSTDDIKQFGQYLERERKRHYKELAANFTYDNWLKLSEFTIVSIIVFNRRRTGETQHILLSDFLDRESLDDMKGNQLFETLSEEAKKIVLKYSRMHICGKRDRTVPVLLKPDIIDCINLLLLHRTDAGISPENEYLFAKPTSLKNRKKTFRACDLVARLANKCGAADPLSLRGTLMRKHVATMCATMELNDGSVNEVADFMGHSIQVHRKHYRHNTLEKEVVKMSQLLQLAQGYEDSDDESSESDVELDENTIKLDENTIKLDESTIRKQIRKVKASGSRMKKSPAGKVAVAKGSGSTTKKSAVVETTVAKASSRPKKSTARKSTVAKGSVTKQPAQMDVEVAVSTIVAEEVQPIKVTRQRKLNPKYSPDGDYEL